ncbi:hypothetical protein AB1Y20_016126 [Prymnesium parvum]|uniref:Fe2OG dioxygenase domain-containing protein n=1 Tax=Prymnesium parvum TaxID=97485 RepID=A0AB34K3E8_PRYPA
MAAACSSDGGHSESLRVILGDSVRRIGPQPLERTFWEWLPCHEHAVRNAATLFPLRETWREPPIDRMCCMPARGCFRGVMDAAVDIPPRHFSVGQRVRMRNYANRQEQVSGWESGRVASVGPPLRVRPASRSSRMGEVYDEVRPIKESDDVYDLEIVERVRKLLVRQLDIPDSHIVSSVWRRQTIKPMEGFAHRNAWHFDYGQHSWAIFSALLYVGNEADVPLVGGWTGFVDTEPPSKDGETSLPPGLERLSNGSAVLHRGLAVAPVPGRIVIFSGGAENYHAPLPVAQGRRQSLQMWFKCAC